MQRSKNIFPVIIIGTGIILVAIALISQFSNRPQISLPTPTSTPGDVSRVTLLVAKKAYDEKTAVIVDVRDPDSYAAAHIPGAVNIPITEIETRYKELDENQWIITYCT